MANKLALTANQQAHVDSMLGAEPSFVAPVSNRALAELVDEHEARRRSFRSRLISLLEERRRTLATAQTIFKRCGIVRTLFLICYWKVSFRDILYRTERKFELVLPMYFKEDRQ